MPDSASRSPEDEAIVGVQEAIVRLVAALVDEGIIPAGKASVVLEEVIEPLPREVQELARDLVGAAIVSQHRSAILR